MSFVGDFIGDITGTNKAAESQQAGVDKSIALQDKMYTEGVERMSPYNQVGMAMIPQLMQTMQPIDRAQALSDYYAGPEYAMMEEAANRSLMAQGEAGGGMGSSTMTNNLMRIAPSMGNQYLGMLEGQRMDDYNRAMGLVNMGQASAAGTTSMGQSYASNMANLYNQSGQIQASKAMAPFQTVMGGLDMGVKAMSGGLF